jgi:hypothetical protein
MPFNLDFNICQTDCETLLFTDTTGEYISGVEECCKTGYGYPGNPTKDQVVSTRFDITYPDGTTVYSDVDFNYIPPVYACDSFEIQATGGSGSIAVVGDGITLGTAIETTGPEQLAQDLVNSINAGTEQHNYQASYVASASGFIVTICDICGGADANGKTLEVCVFDTTVNKTDLVLSGAGGNENWCVDITSGLIDGTDVNNCFSDGVYTFTMTVLVDPDGEGGEDPIEYSVTKKFLFDCLSNMCLKQLILLASKPDCPCNDKDIHEKIQHHRTNIEAAHVLFENCEYDCANDLIQETQKYCENVCLDCE